MFRFDWAARDKAGRNLSGTMDASSKEAVMAKLQAQGLVVTKLDMSSAARSGTIDFAARLDGRSPGAVEYTARVEPSARRRPFAAVVIALVFAAVAVGIVRAAGWPPPVVPAVIAAIFLLLAIALPATLVLGLLMPARLAAAVDTLKRHAEESRRS